MKCRELLEWTRPVSLPGVHSPSPGYSMRQELAAGKPSEENMEMGRRIADFIKKNAKPWLSQVNPATFVLYRGLDYSIKPAFLQSSPKNRKPVDTSRSHHQMYNAMIAAVGGKANRSNSIFGTRDFEVALSYGTPYVIIPLGKFSYTYSPQWKDWTFVKLGLPTYNWLWRFDPARPKRPDADDIEKLKKYIRVDRGLKLLRNSEIMISAPRVLHIDYTIFEYLVRPHLAKKGRKS